jgi:hypothetical protein
MKMKLLAILFCVVAAVISGQAQPGINIQTYVYSHPGNNNCIPFRSLSLSAGVGNELHSNFDGTLGRYFTQTSVFVPCWALGTVPVPLPPITDLRSFPRTISLTAEDVEIPLLPITGLRRDSYYLHSGLSNTHTFKILRGDPQPQPIGPPPPDIFHKHEINNVGYFFDVHFEIPVIPSNKFWTRDNNNRSVARASFCRGETIYVENHYKDRPISGAKFQYEITFPGVPSKTFTSLGAGGELEISTADMTSNDPSIKLEGHIRVRLVGPTVPNPNAHLPGGSATPFVDGLRGEWSAALPLTIYPPAPSVDVSPLNPAASLTDQASLTEGNDLCKLQHVKCKGGDNGKLIIGSFQNPQAAHQYLVTVSLLNAIGGIARTMNFRLNNNPTVASPLILPDAAKAVDGSNAFCFTAGRYEIKIEGVNELNGSPYGCISTQHFTIKEPEVFETHVSQPKYHTFDVSCYDDGTGQHSKDGRIAVDAEGGIGPYNFTLKGFTGATEVYQEIIGTANDFQFSNLSPVSSSAAITYTVTMTDASECPSKSFTNGITTPLALIVPPPINISESDDDKPDHYGFNIKCFGGTDDIAITTTGGTKNYAVWIEGGGLSANYQRRDVTDADQPVFSVLPAGHYTTRVIDGNHCAASKTFEFTQPARLSIEESEITSPDCFGNNTGAIRIDALGGVPLGGQQYTYKLVHNSPPPPHTWPIGFEPAPPAKTGEEIIFTGLISGPYTITISDELSCEQPYPFTIVEPTRLSVATDPDEIICYGDASGNAVATASGGTAPYTLQWLNAEKDVINSVLLAHPGDQHTLINQTAGQYYAKLIDAHSCENESVFIISQPAAPLDITAAQADIHHISCHGANDGRVTLHVTGGWSPYSLGKSATDLRPNAFSYSGLAQGIHRFFVSDLKGCLRSIDVTIHEPEILAGTGGDIRPVSCHGDSDGSFTPVITGGTAPYELYAEDSGWTPAGFVNGMAEGSYPMKVRDANGCLSDFNVIIPTPAVLDVDLISSGDTQCGESNGHATISISGGNTPYSIGWSLDDRPVAGTLTATALPSGVYKVMITDTKNCQTSMNVGISDSDAAIITIADVTPITCFGDSDGTASITLTGGILPYTEILWTMGQTGLKATGLTASDHIVSVKDQAGCISTKQITIPGPDPLLATFKDVINPHCFGDENGSVRVEASGGTAPYSYRWSNTSNSSDHMKDAGAGILSVGITDVNGCVLDTQYDLQQPPEVEVDLRGEEFFCTGQTVKLDAGNPGATYQWASTIGVTGAARVFEATQTGTYTVTVTDARGCIGTGSRDLTFDSNILRADFISTSEAVAGDTVVLINVSFPLPDSSYWKLPDGVTVIEASYFVQYVVFPDSGIYTITLSATKGECFDQIQDNIIIHERKVKDNDDSGGRKANLITAFTIHPNPSSGKFKISVQLRETAQIEIKIFSYAGGYPWAAYQDADKESYEINAEMNAPPGVYAIVLEAGNEKTVKRFIIY